MAKINKISKIYPIGGAPITESDIQAHLDAMNADGWELVAITDLNGWYRMYWAKDVA